MFVVVESAAPTKQPIADTFALCKASAKSLQPKKPKHCKVSRAALEAILLREGVYQDAETRTPGR